MGTTITLLFPEEQVARGTALVQSLFEEWERTLSRFLPDSELSRLNRNAGQDIEVGPLLFHVLETALTAAEATHGLYDPTLLHQLTQVGYDRSFDSLDRQQAENMYSPSPGGRWRDIQIEKHTRCVRLPRGVGVDFGGIAKGMAVDAALARLQDEQVSPALVNAGGDLAVSGLPPDEAAWSIAIEDGQGEVAHWIVPLERGCMATSGIARRQWRQGAQVRHHLLDPRTGLPAQNSMWSVSVVAARCEQAEVAAKVAFLLGMERGSEFLRSTGLSGLLLEDDGTWQAVGSWPAKQRYRRTRNQKDDRY
jgi:thiamine biosynthesis lipoprotein